MTTITDQKLAELEALCEAARAGGIWLVVNRFQVIDDIGNLICETRTSPFSDVEANAKAAFIAAAREALPSLIKRVRELEAEILSLHEDAAGADI